MTERNDVLFGEKQRLVLIRLKTLNPHAKVMFGDGKSFSVKDIIKHVEDGDDFGKDVISAQMEMLKVLAEGV